MDVVERCYEYLSNGGLFNPELMDHEAVSNLVIDCRNEIERLRQQNAELTIDPNIKMLLAGKKALYRLIEDPTFDDARAVYMAMVAANKATGGE